MKIEIVNYDVLKEDSLSQETNVYKFSDDGFERLHNVSEQIKLEEEDRTLIALITLILRFKDYEKFSLIFYGEANGIVNVQVNG